MYSEQGVPTVAEHRGAVPPDKVVNVVVVNPSKKMVRLPLFFKSVAFNRMIDPSQFRFGKGAFTQTLLPKEKIPSPATRSGAIPSSCIFWACSQALPVPNQIERFA